VTALFFRSACHLQNLGFDLSSTKGRRNNALSDLVPPPKVWPRKLFYGERQGIFRALYQALPKVHKDCLVVAITSPVQIITRVLDGSVFELQLLKPDADQ